MPFESRRAKLHLQEQEVESLRAVAGSRSEGFARVQRAGILLAYHRGESVSAIARSLNTNRPKVERCISKALGLGVAAALSDLPREGRPPRLTPEAKAWVVSCACAKPKDFGYSYELWTTRLLSQHIRAHCEEQGHPCLKQLARGTVSKILSQNRIKPHKIRYYLERRDPEFEEKMIQVLHVYKEVQILSESNGNGGLIAILSYDEKPGIQAIGSTAPDLPPCPGEHPTIGRDHEYVRHGTLSLLAGIDLLTGHVLALVESKHRSREFVAFLKMVDAHYADRERIRIILDNHSAHISKETRAYLSTVPNRFEFVFTPKHGSWLNLIESFFGKMAKTVLRGIRVGSKDELKERILRYMDEINAVPVVHRWKYKLDSLSVV